MNSGIPPDCCIMTYVLPDGRRCWYVARAPKGPNYVSGPIVPDAIQKTVQMLGGELAWGCYGPPHNQDLAGGASERCAPVKECPNPPPTGLVCE
jgi:hypothetical protein